MASAEWATYCVHGVRGPFLLNRRNRSRLKLSPRLADLSIVSQPVPLAERLGNGLQIRLPRFESGRGLSPAGEGREGRSPLRPSSFFPSLTAYHTQGDTPT
jgi:hypothetical protein